MSLAIVSQANAVPPGIVDQAEASDLARKLSCRTAEQATWLPTMYAGTGVRTRRSALRTEERTDFVQGTQHTGSVFIPKGTADDLGPTTAQRMERYEAESIPLALEATAAALSAASYSTRDITHLITVSCTGFYAPGIDYFLINGLGLLPTTLRTHIGFMGCHGALNGLRVAQAFATSDPDARILLCAVELCTLHYFYGWDPQKVIANAIFSDGCAALVGAPAAVAPAGAWKVAATGSCLIPDSADAMKWIIGDHGFEMTLSKKVPGLIAQHLRPWLESWLGRNGLKLSAIGSWAIHPGGPRILGAAQEALALTYDHTGVAREVFAEFGNMSSPTVLFILDRLRRANAPRPCVALGFGPGLVAEAVLFR